MEIIDLPIYVGTCRVCGYGMLEVTIGLENRKCKIMCDECLAEWETPEKALNRIGGIRKSYEKAVARSATLEEAKEAGWEQYILK